MRRTALQPIAPLRYLTLLLIPLRPVALLTLIVLSVTLGYSLMAGAFGIPLIFILLSWLFKYSFALLDSLVAGETALPVLSLEMILGSWGEWRSLLPLIIVVVVFFTSGAGAFWAGELVAAVLAITAIACLPAVLAVQGWTGSAGQSLSPHVCRRMARILGGDYAWMVGCTFAVAAIYVVMPEIVGGVPRVFRIGMLIYAWLAVIAVTGGALYAKREVLERETTFISPHQHPESPEEVDRLRERWLDSIYAAWRSKAHENAWRSVMDWIEHRAEPLQEFRWLYSRIAAWEQPQLADRIVHEMLPRLLAADRDGEALRLVKERLEIDSRFLPQTSDERRRLAQLAGEWGDRSTSETLLRDLHD